MPVAGRKPKPEGFKRNRVKPTHEWVEVPSTPYAGEVPDLPDAPATEWTGEVPEPPRPLGSAGRELWERAWRTSGPAVGEADALLVVCEQMDERVALRVRVLREGNWRDRAGLRMLDAQIVAGLSALGLDATERPTGWPAATLRWWRAISRMPHCVVWTASDWQFALDTAVIAAAFHAGDYRLAAELRQREKVLGTTVDARRDLRIRYLDPDSEDEVTGEDLASVTVMADYKRMVTDQE